MRRRCAEKRKTIPDARYNNELVGKFINCLMVEGKKTTVERIVYDAIDLLKERTGEDGLKVFLKAIENARPRVELKPRRVGGATYQIPVEVLTPRGNSLVMRWFRDFARKKKGKPMTIKLAEEFLAAYKMEGAAIKKRDETHKMAEANKAFAHLRW